MKVGEIEGSPQEIKDLMENHGLNLDDYIEKPEKPIESIWLIIPAVIYFLFLLINIVVTDNPSILNFTFISSICVALWLTIVIHIRYKMPWASTLVIIVATLISLVSIDVMKPHDLITYMEKFRG